MLIITLPITTVWLALAKFKHIIMINECDYFLITIKLILLPAIVISLVFISVPHPGIKTKR